MPTLCTYIATSLTFTITYSCSLISLFMPEWLRFESPRPYKTITNYGLFQKCSTLNDVKCREFPSLDYGDCEERGFCEAWIAARDIMIIAAVIGGLTLIYCIIVLLSGGSHHLHAWKVFVALLQISSIALISHLYNTSQRFLYGIRFDNSYFLATGSFVVNFLLSIALFLFGRSFRPSYDPI
ncbi:170_t:CDS:2, partial [Funneliformis geosporum]